MFGKRKHKNSGQMSYDINKFNHAYKEWGEKAPKLDFKTSTCVISSLYDKYKIYITPHFDGTVRILASTKEDNSTVDFIAYLTWKQFYYITLELDTVRDLQRGYPYGIVLEGLNFYDVGDVSKALN